MPTLDYRRWLSNALTVLPKGSLVVLSIPGTRRDGNPGYAAFIEGGNNTGAAEALDMLAATQSCLDRQVQAACGAIAADTGMKLDDMLDHFKTLVAKHATETAQDHESTAKVERKPSALERLRQSQRSIGLGGIGP